LGISAAQWLQNVNATTTLGDITILAPRRDFTAVVSPLGFELQFNTWLLDNVSIGAILTAVCQTRAGGRRTSSINVVTCRDRDIANVNGHLTCRAGPQPPAPPKPVPPAPPGLQAIAYAQPNYRGAKLIINGPIPDLAKRGFDNRIQSLTIIRGRAEVCVDANYRGRCVRFTKSEPDIRTYRLFNSISSIR